MAGVNEWSFKTTVFAIIIHVHPHSKITHTVLVYRVLLFRHIPTYITYTLSGQLGLTVAVGSPTLLLSQRLATLSTDIPPLSCTFCDVS